MLSLHGAGSASRGELRRPQLRWITLVLLAVVLDLVDGFWATSLHGAVGAVDRTQEPFDSWIRSSEVMLPFYVLAVAMAAVIARRWLGASRRNLVRPVLLAVLVVVMTIFVGIGELTVNAVNDYRVQSEELEAVHSRHSATTATGAQPETAGHHAADTGCDARCAAAHTTLVVHERAIAFGSAVLLLTNIVLVAFLVVLWDVRLWT